MRIRSISTMQVYGQCEDFTVLIPLRIRSISTASFCVRFVTLESWSLNPFENQVYFYPRNTSLAETARCLNPFENQVYFYNLQKKPIGFVNADVLIPLRIRSISTRLFFLWLSVSLKRLNPFENQVYFYLFYQGRIAYNNAIVLIPLRIRSISTTTATTTTMPARARS